MQASHTWRAGSAVFDEENLVSCAGLVPVMELAEQAGRVIHAYSAVREALTAMVHIQTPDDNGILPAHKLTVFTATTYDDGHGTPFVTWRVDGNVTAVGHTLAPAVAWTAHRDRDRHLRRRDHRHRFDPGDRVQLPADRAHQFAG